MNYLVTVGSLAVRDGSALASIEIARELQQRGHEVAIFSLRVGEWAREQAGVPCWSIREINEVVQFGPRGIVLLHWPTYFALKQAGVVAPTVFGFLGVLPPLENPPPLLASQHFPWFAVSESILANVGAQSTWSQSTHAVIRNWTAWPPGTLKAPNPLRTMAIVSNRMPESLEAQITRVAHELGIAVTRFGLPNNSVEVSPELLAPFDAIIGIGRTVLDAMQLGRPVLISDLHGSEGWVTSTNVEVHATESFSARRRAHHASDDEFRTWFESPPGLEEIEELQNWVGANATVVEAVAVIEDLMKQASIPSPDWGSFGEAVVEAWAEIDELQWALRERERQLRELAGERDDANEIINRWRSLIDRIPPKFLITRIRRIIRRRLFES